MSHEPELCQICGLWPVCHGIGFWADPRRNPGLPGHLRGTQLWVCGDPACTAEAQTRAIKAAAEYRVKSPNLCRVSRPG